MFANYVNRRFVTIVSIAVVFSVTMMAAMSEAATGADGNRNQDRQPDKSVRIGHYQCICHQGDFEKNLQTVITDWSWQPRPIWILSRFLNLF